VSTLIKWFPDRRGMAIGMAIMGFGGGAMIGSPLATMLMNHYATPTSVGVWETFVTLGLIYFVFMLGGAFGYGCRMKRSNSMLNTLTARMAARDGRVRLYRLLRTKLGHRRRNEAINSSARGPRHAPTHRQTLAVPEQLRRAYTLLMATFRTELQGTCLGCTIPNSWLRRRECSRHTCRPSTSSWRTAPAAHIEAERTLANAKAIDRIKIIAPVLIFNL
jgi:MFS family permease